jgi:hypothetical protein
MPSSSNQRRSHIDENPRLVSASTTYCTSRGLPRATDDELLRFVARTTAASDVPLLVEDLSVLEQIARVLSCAPVADNSPCRPSDALARRVAVSRVVS